MIVIPERSLFIVRYRLIMQKYLPKHNYNESGAIEFDGRLGIVLNKVQSKVNRQIYRCLIGDNPIELGKSWLDILSSC